MPSTYSPSLRIELIGTGEQDGVWGVTTNNNLWPLLEQAVTGVTTISVTAADVTLTSLNGTVDQARSAVLNVTGAAGVSRNIVIPNQPKQYTVFNGANAVVVITTGSGTTYSCPAGYVSFVSSTGSNVVAGVTPVAYSGGAMVDPSYTGTMYARLGAITEWVDPGNSNYFTVQNDGAGYPWKYNGTEFMRLTQTGKLGIGTNSPVVPLHVIGNAYLYNGGLSLGASGFSDWRIFNNSNFLYYTFNGSNSAYVDHTTGAWTPISDGNLKKNIETITDGLERVMRYRPVEYNMKTEEDGAQKHRGFIAQEAREVSPSSVGEFPDGTLGMDKTEVIADLVNAIQTLKAEFDAYKAAHP